MPPKRKSATSTSSEARPAKKPLKQTTLLSAASVATPSTPTPEPHDYDAALINHKYYPPAPTNATCKAYATGEKSRPIDELTQALSSTSGFRTRVPKGRAVIHWFRTDLRIDDNTALHLASQYGGQECAVIGLFILSPQDVEAHSLSPARVDFMLRSLAVVKDDLAELGIPLWCETVERRRDVPGRVMELTEKWGAKHVFANMEYEVDELRRDAKVVRLGEQNGVAVNVVHDTCVVPPEELKTKSTGKAFAVYTPWYKAWQSHLLINKHLLTLHPPPRANPPSALTTYSVLFTSPIPTSPIPLTPTELETQHSLFPAGAHEAHSRLQHFLDTSSSAYQENRNIPSLPGTSVLSPHFATGTISTRTAVSRAKSLPTNAGIQCWISELAWRDFYRHILASFAHVCMHKPFTPSFSSITWSATSPNFSLWTAGLTGYPLVDAAMRQLAAQKWMPNRCRMVVASFLPKDLLIDWRMGEKYFMEQLVDGDFASNSGGWGWSSSTGADPQPYFRVFNPQRQAEQWDPLGEYVRAWIPELRDVKGKEIFEPSRETRKRTGYPMRVVEHAVVSKVAVGIYKEGKERGEKEP